VFRLVDMGVVSSGPGAGALSTEGNMTTASAYRRSSASAAYASLSQEQKRYVEPLLEALKLK
jgi:hypothetical protein